MTFVSFEYLFLLVVSVFAYHLLPWRARIVLLVSASYLFYAYWKPYYAWVIAGTTVVDYLAGLGLDRAEQPRSRKLLLSASLTANLGALAFFKYTNFALDVLQPLLSAAAVPASTLDIALPVGISFYTFQAMSYTIDVYRRRIPATRDFLLFACYVSFFPQLVAGPIERAESLMGQLAVKQPLRLQQACDGVGLIFIGLAKKLVVADRLSHFALPSFLDPSGADGLKMALSLAAMPIALYLDFGAYTDIARGSGRLFGIELSRNFVFPLAATNPAEYWNRWHITLSHWMRDYVFRPLGGIVRHSAARTTLNTLLTMALVGLWHGAAWKFVLWGIANGVALAAYYLIRLRAPWLFRIRTLPTLGWLVALSWLLGSSALFFAPDVPTAVRCWGQVGAPWTSWSETPIQALAAFLVAFALVQAGGKLLDYRSAWDRVPVPIRGFAFALLFYVVLFGAVPTAQQFVYFQF